MTYTPDTDFSGSDSFSYTVSDGSSGVVNVIVNLEEDILVAQSQLSVDVGENFSPQVSIASGSIAATGSVWVAWGDGTTETLSFDSGTGQVNLPNHAYWEPGTFEASILAAIDGQLQQATVEIVVSNNAGIAANDTYTTPFNTPVNSRLTSSGLLGNDSLDGQSTWTIRLRNEGDRGFTTVITSGGASGILSTQHGSLTVNPDGTIEYDPDVDFSGVDSFVYELENSSGESSLTRVQIYVRDSGDDQNTAATDLTFHAARGETLTIADREQGLLARSTDPDGDRLAYFRILSNNNSGLDLNNLTVNADGTFSYTHSDDDFTGELSFEYSVSPFETTGPVDISERGVVTLNYGNNAPEVSNDFRVVPQGDEFVVEADFGLFSISHDIDGDELEVARINDQVVNFSPTNTSHTTSATGGGYVTVNEDGSYSYDPAVGFEGRDSFTFMMVEDRPASDRLFSRTATVTLDVFQPRLFVNDDAYGARSGVVLNVAAESGFWPMTRLNPHYLWKYIIQRKCRRNSAVSS